MRWILGILILLALAVLGGLRYVRNYPYQKYSEWIQGSGWDKYYEISNYSKLYLAPTGVEEIPPYKEDYTQLWRQFPIRNSNVPLPTRHPLFLTVPLVQKTSGNLPHLGMIIQSSNGRELSRVLSLPTSLYPDNTQGQELFKLPYVKNRILKKGLNETWKDLFSYVIEIKPKPIDEMIYDLYILHLRSKMLPKETVRYGLIQGGKQALIEFDSPNKDYMVELVMNQVNGSIYSYVLRTEKINQDSTGLRSKFLSTIEFSPIDSALSRLLYTEFKQLNFARQVDQEGMIYLFSAWSQDPENVELLKEMIFYLERGQNNQQHLKELYQYAYRRYGKTFTGRQGEELDDPEIQLQRKIEIEQAKRRLDAEKAQIQTNVEPTMSPEEKMNLYLKKAKEEKLKNKKEMKIH
jgi:hypothetical protein